MKANPSKNAKTLGDLVRAADTLGLELHVRLTPVPSSNYRQRQIDSLSKRARAALVKTAGEEVLRLFAGDACRLCAYGDHDQDGTERHEDECPLRVLDDH